MALPIPQRACSSNERMTRPALLGSFQQGTKTREFLESIPEEDLVITSFDSNSRIVCFSVTTDFGVNSMTVTLPVISNSNQNITFRRR